LDPTARAFTHVTVNAEIHLLDGGHFLLETACDTIAELHILGHVGLPARHCPGQWTGLADPAWRPIQRRCRRRADPEGKLTVGPEAAA